MRIDETVGKIEQILNMEVFLLQTIGEIFLKDCRKSHNKGKEIEDRVLGASREEQQ